MRGLILAGVMVAGAAGGVAAPKAAPPKPAAPKAKKPDLVPPFVNRVTVERIDPNTRQIKSTVAEVDAYPSGGGHWTVRASDLRDGPPATGDRIIGPDGAVWLVGKVRVAKNSRPLEYHCDAKIVVNAKGKD